MALKRITPTEMFDRAEKALEEALLDMVMAFFVWRALNTEGNSMEEEWLGFKEEVELGENEVISSLLWEAIEAWVA